MHLDRHKLIARLAIALAVLIILAGSPAAGVRPAMAQPPDPETIASGIYVGAVPPGAEQNPVLVFVHGYGASAGCWWGPTKYDGVNDMYITAYNAGYRTAFVSLDGPEGRPADSMWANGLTLSLQLRIIAGHYGVDDVVIVAHSKGGVDAQAAIVYFGGWERVGRLFTLGSPHQGSEMADAAYSWWGSPLAELLGFHDDGTYTLQTAYMSFFREYTDPKAQTQPVTYYSGAGMDMGPEGSILHLMGRYLSRFGDSDGIVTVASTALPGASTLFLQPYHHMNIYMGSTAFPWIDSVLKGAASAWAQTARVASSRQMPSPLVESGRILRGGRLSGAAVETFPIEPYARRAVFDVIVSEEAVTATLIGPDGRARPLKAAGEGDDLFGASWHWSHTSTRPRAGEWTLRIDGPPGAAYLLIAAIESPLQVALRGFPERMVAPGQALEFSAESHALLARPVVQQVEAHITRALPGQAGRDLAIRSSSDPAFSWVPSREGIYSVSATVTGQTAGGMAFERSFVRSLAVVKPQTLSGPPTLLDE
jgi:pimeloyl-ACP methyl ester carboxylesterase